jgi:hypothetical protein
MQRKWPFITVASLLNASLVTGVFISLYPRGFTIAERCTITPFLFATAMFVLTFLIIIAGMAIKLLVSGIISRLKMFSHSLTLVDKLIS